MRKIFRKYESSSKLTIYNLHSTSEEYFEEYRELLTKLDNKECFINPVEINELFKDKLAKNHSHF